MGFEYNLIAFAGLFVYISGLFVTYGYIGGIRDEMDGIGDIVTIVAWPIFLVALSVFKLVLFFVNIGGVNLKSSSNLKAEHSSIISKEGLKEPITLINEGWFWVDCDGVICPALYKNQTDCFYSYHFAGVPSKQLKVLSMCKYSHV